MQIFHAFFYSKTLNNDVFASVFEMKIFFFIAYSSNWLKKGYFLLFHLISRYDGTKTRIASRIDTIRSKWTRYQNRDSVLHSKSPVDLFHLFSFISWRDDFQLDRYDIFFYIVYGNFSSRYGSPLSHKPSILFHWPWHRRRIPHSIRLWFKHLTLIHDSILKRMIGQMVITFIQLAVILKIRSNIIIGCCIDCQKCPIHIMCQAIDSSIR